MKRIVSVSLGSSTRDHKAEREFFGEKYLIERVGVDGSYEKFINKIKELDGKVDAIGMGGIGLYLPMKNRTYVLKSALPLLRAAKITPVADGTFIRDTLEPQAVYKVRDKKLIDFKGKKAMVTCAVDRYRLAEALYESGCSIICADLIFTLGINVTVGYPRGINALARVFAPIVTKLPFDMLYPTGHREEAVEDPVKYAKLYREADIIAGDFNYIKRYMPDDLTGKVIITNTVTKANIEELKSRKVAILVTTTPEFDGRSFGTNVVESIVVAASGKRPNEISREEYQAYSEKLGFEPRVVIF
ncbi:MAG TPA: quinate 5-dehydrogenase [Clostridiaceae bacterium]|nr:quinate 5-dehydrogenase [Clostridiaceae bacterium]